MPLASGDAFNERIADIRAAWLAASHPFRRPPARSTPSQPVHFSPLTWFAQKPQFMVSFVTSMHSPPHILPGGGQSPEGEGLAGAGLSDGGGEEGESAGASAGEAGGDGLSAGGEGSAEGGGAGVLPLLAEVLRKPELQVTAEPCGRGRARQGGGGWAGGRRGEQKPAEQLRSASCHQARCYKIPCVMG